MGKSEDPSKTSGHKLLQKLFGNNTIVYVTDSRGSTKRNKKVKKAEMKQKVCDFDKMRRKEGSDDQWRVRTTAEKIGTSATQTSSIVQEIPEKKA